MAKNRDAGDGIERADAAPDDRQALLDRVAALEAENAALRNKPAPAAAPAVPTGPVTRWRGFVKYGVAIVVEATDAVHAQHAYMQAAGLIRTENQVEVSPVADDTPLGPVL